MYFRHLARMGFPQCINKASYITACTPQAVGLVSSNTTSANNTLLVMSDDTNPLCIEATMYAIKVLFDIGEASHPYLTEDVVGTIEI